MNEKDLEDTVESINYDDINLEIAWQIELIIRLRQNLGENYKVLPEVSLPQKNIKKEIDIVIEDKTTKEKVAIELKMPLKGAYPKQMSEAIVDIAFLESLKNTSENTSRYSKCFFIMMTNDSVFWKGRKKDGIYKYFRSQENENQEYITGKIEFPKFFKGMPNKIEIKGNYIINWQTFDKDRKWQYFIIEV